MYNYIYTRFNFVRAEPTGKTAVVPGCCCSPQLFVVPICTAPMVVSPSLHNPAAPVPCKIAGEHQKNSALQEEIARRFFTGGRMNGV